MPRHHVLLAALAAFVIGLITGAVGAFVASDYRKAFQHVQEENRVLRKMNELQKRELEEIQTILKPQPATKPVP